MKQRITKQQILDLDILAFKKLSKLCIEEGIWEEGQLAVSRSFEGKAIHLFQLSIGQMIELLTDELTFSIGYMQMVNSYTGERKMWSRITLKEQGYAGIELCDVLWEAVRYKLDND